MTGLPSVLRRPLARSTARLRLTLAYGALFLLSGTLLLATSYVVVRAEFAPSVVRGSEVPAPRLWDPRPEFRPPPDQVRVVEREVAARNRAALRRVLAFFAMALVATTVASLILGWFLAGRVLRPLSRITAAARRVSEENLHERIALEGPDDELKELADTFDAMLGQLDRAFESQRRFIGHASHELRTPLAVMRTVLDVTLEDPSPSREDLEAMAARIREAIERSEQLTRRLLTLASSDRGLDHREPIELHRVLRRIRDEQMPAAAERDLRLELDVEAATVPGDEVLLAQLVSNLLDNAIRYNRDGGWIGVRCGTRQGQAVLVVANDGGGIAPDEVAGLVTPFRRLQTDDASRADGFGLGLSIVDSVARAHGGTLDLRGRQEGGLEVEVRLPVVGQPSLADAPPGARHEAVPG